MAEWLKGFSLEVHASLTLCSEVPSSRPDPSPNVGIFLGVFSGYFPRFGIVGIVVISIMCKNTFLAVLHDC